MDAVSFALSNTLKVGLNVFTNYKRPVLEIYHEVRNRCLPEQELNSPFPTGVKSRGIKYTPQEILICFTLVNIGGVRAENVVLKITGDLKRNPPRESFGEKFNHSIEQIAPGQPLFLFSFDEFDLLTYSEKGGSPIGNKTEKFTITMMYDGPTGLINKFLSIFNKMRGKKQFCTTYTFSPGWIFGDLPPTEYM